MVGVCGFMRLTRPIFTLFLIYVHRVSLIFCSCSLFVNKHYSEENIPSFAGNHVIKTSLCNCCAWEWNSNLHPQQQTSHSSLHGWDIPHILVVSRSHVIPKSSSWSTFKGRNYHTTRVLKGPGLKIQETQTRKGKQLVVFLTSPPNQ